MKVILKEDVKGTGKKGDILDVSDGYAKNYLLKKGLAEIASPTAVNALNIKRAAEERRRQEEIAAIREAAKKLSGATVTIPIRCGENGRVFGSVTSKEIAGKLAEAGYDIDKKKILLKEPIKQAGQYNVEIRMMEGVTPKITVIVVPSGQEGEKQ